LGGSRSISSTFQSSPTPHSTAARVFTWNPLVIAGAQDSEAAKTVRNARYE
jgi:hypothetical protein